MGHEWSAGGVVRFWEAREVVACLARAGEAGANSQPGSSIPTLCGH